MILGFVLIVFGFLFMVKEGREEKGGKASRPIVPA
jgi:hypothetical protein